MRALGKKAKAPSSPTTRVLETFDAPRSAPLVRFECPEFTALCPKTGQPDFANITIWYKPIIRCVELKSLKLYLWAYRNTGAFHEAVTEGIAKDLAAVVQPMWLLVEGNFWVRGGIHTVVWSAREHVPEELLTARMGKTDYRGH